MERVPRTGASVYRQPPPPPDLLPVMASASAEPVSAGKVALCRNNAPQEFASHGSFQKCRFQPRARLVPDQIHGRHTLVEFVFFPRQFLHESRDFATHARQWTFSRSCWSGLHNRSLAWRSWVSQRDCPHPLRGATPSRGREVCDMFPCDCHDWGDLWILQGYSRQLQHPTSAAWGQCPWDGHRRIQQALRRWNQRNRIPRGPRPPAAGLHQSKFNFGLNVIFFFYQPQDRTIFCWNWRVDFYWKLIVVGLCYFDVFDIFFLIFLRRNRWPPVALTRTTGRTPDIASGWHNWKLDKIGDSGVKQVILKYGQYTTYCSTSHRRER